MTDIFSFFKSIENDIIRYRRELHARAETGFELYKTSEYIKKTLQGFGCKPIEIGKCGIYTMIGSGNHECILLRADADALPIKEETDLPFCSADNMHACGHDLHSAILLGVARYLKSIENCLKRPVKLLFQPAEEILEGAKNMIESGILENPPVTSAYMLHAMTSVPLKSGTIVVSDGGVSAPATKYFEISILGKGCHGAMPNSGIDPIIPAVNIVTMLDTIRTRELSIYDRAVLTIGSISAGTVHNIIPETAKICGTFRTFDKKIVPLIEDSIKRISRSTARAFRCEAVVSFPMEAPPLSNDCLLSENALNILKNELSDDLVISSGELASKLKTEAKSTGSEDFAYYSEHVPSLMIGLAAGNHNDGYKYPLHHPKTIFDESALIYGATALSLLAIKK